MRDWLNIRQSIRVMMTAAIVWAGMPMWIRAAEPVDDAGRKTAAVALNYSRAAFHRIRRNPSVRVLWEEQEKILNHLNLNAIGDEEVVKLYTAVLDEIAQIQLGDREKELLQEKYRRQFQRDVAINALSLGAQVATAQYATAVRTGANSWWDYRSQTQNRELDLFRVDKERMTRLMSKSAQFLDVSWKMARTKQIPDRWLVRGDDLDKLEDAWKEPDFAVRLRVLKRMEPFLEQYPPYWYYVARTQQSLGQLFAASETYEKLATIGQGHFRKDEMLACGLANRALIQAFLSQPGAAETAQQAMTYSTDVWEANLLCGVVLQRYHRYTEAEDSYLRNLDVGQAKSQSQQALIGLYYASDNLSKLVRHLSDPAVVVDLPPALLVRCAAKLGDAQTPPVVAHVLQRSLQVSPRYNLGRDDLVVQAHSNWNLPHAQVTLTIGDRTFDAPRWSTQNQVVTASFDGVGEFGSPLTTSDHQRDLTLTVQYLDSPPLKLALQLTAAESAGGETGSTLGLTTRRTPVYRVTGLEQEQVRMTFHNGVARTLVAGSPASPPTFTNGASPTYAPSTVPTLPTGNTALKPTVDDAYLVTPPIEIPIVPPT